jgi:ABC-2 type transport system permease protein
VRVATALLAGLREYARSRVLVALLLFLPVYMIGVFLAVIPDSTVPLDVAGAGTVRATMVEVYATMLTPMTAALVGGIAGLFVMADASAGDRRLVVAGFRPHEVVLARFGMLAVAGVVVTAVSMAVAARSFVPEQVGWFAAATVLAALTYGAVGTLLGLVVGRLAGVYALLAGAMLDLFLYQNPLTAADAALAPYLPGHYAVELAVSAGFATGVDGNTVAGALGYVAVVLALSTAAFYLSTTR